ASTINDIKEALKQMLGFKNSGCYCLVNFHFFIKDPGIIQIIKDIIYKWKSSDEAGNKHLIFIENVLTIPVELEKEITVLDYELPNKKELTDALNSVIIDDAGKLRIKKLTDAQTDKALSAALGMTYLEAENAYAISVIEKETIDVSIINREKGQILKKGGLLDFFPATETLDDVGGLDNLKDWLRKRGKAFSPEAVKFGLPSPRGILMVGIPGSGKSLCAKAVAQTWNLPLIRVDIGKAFGSLVGESESKIRSMTKQLDAMSPCVAWVDEIEKGFAGTNSSGITDSGVTMRVLGTFLTWKAECKKPVFLIATANNVFQLPPELLRKGRFDEIFYIDLPTAAERSAIFNIHLKKRGRDPKKFDIDMLVAHSADLVGSEIEEAIISGMYDAFDANREVTTEDIVNAVKASIPLIRTMSEQVEKTRQWAQGKARPASLADDNNVNTSRKLDVGGGTIRKGLNFKN
ncbi:MAG: AAA family ATPase, partial [Candidatus Daviesbacteria bacterium]|nr:AAA family ATPase [Candidatus Daviesbacteria bacterium]